MENQLQNRGKWTTLFLLALLLTGGTTIKAQTWAYFAEDKELFKDGAVLKNVTVKEGTEKELVIGNNSDLTVTTLDMTGTIAGGYIVTEIGMEAFSGVGFTSFVCPEDLKVINEGAFSLCTSLTSLTLNEKLVEIGINAFDRVISLPSVTLPKSLTTLGSGAFKSCGALTTVNIPAESQLTSIGESAFSRCSKLAAFEIPAGVTKIDAYVFSNSGLTSINFPATLKVVQNAAFGFCQQLATVTVASESQLTTLGEEAFASCPKLASFEIPAGVTTIAASVFSGTGLTSVRIPSTVTTIEGMAFGFCASLARIDCDHITQPSVSSNAFSGGPEDRVVYALKANPRNWDKTLWGAKEVIYVGNWAFDAVAKTLVKGGVTVNNVTVKEGSEKELVIGDNAELIVTELDMSGEINGGYQITEIAENAFSGTSLVSVTLPADLKVIGESAFSICTSLVSVTFNDKLVEIGNTAFDRTLALKAIELPQSLTTIGDKAFNSCGELASVTLPEGSMLSSIGASAFTRCGKLTSFTFPAGVTRINSFTFSNSGLTSITLPATITEISESGFGFCKTLSRIDCLHTTEPVLVSNPFVGGPEDRKVYALNADPQNWDKEKWGAEEIIYTLNSIGTVDGEQVRVWIDGGVLQIASQLAEQVRIVSIDGVSRDMGIVSGNMQVALPDGISIVVVGDRKYKIVK